MNKTCLFVLAAVLMLAAAEGFQEIGTVDCNGAMTLFGSHDLLKMRLHTPLKPWMDFALSALLGRGQCYCPSMTSKDFDRIFLIGQFFNAIQGPSKDTSLPCADQDWLADTWRYGLLNSSKISFALPGGCDLATWLNAGACQIKQEMPALGLTIQGAFKKCPNSNWPFISMTCAGAGCEKLLMPCNGANECGSPLPCQPIGPVCSYSNRSECPPDFIYNWTQTQMYNATHDMSLYDNGDTNPGCYEANKFFEDIISRARAHYRQTSTPYIFASNGLYTMKMCMKFDDTYMFQLQNTTQTSDVNISQSINLMDIQCIIRALPTNTQYFEIKCDSLAAWDGQIDGARGSVVQSGRMDGSYFGEVTPSPQAPTEPAAYLLMSHTCDNEVHLLPSNPRLHFFATIPSLSDNINWFFNNLFGMQRCRAQLRFSDLTWENFRIRFFDFAGMLYQFVLPGAANPLTSWRVPAMSDWSPNSTAKIVMPATCTYDSWMNDGMCSLQWTGLQSMLKMGITLRAYAKDCGAFRLPEFKVECIGTACPLFLNPTFCTDASTCPSGAECIDVYDELYNTDNENSTTRDIFQAFYKLNLTEPDTCGSEVNGRKFVRDAIRFARGESSDGQSGTKICMANFTYLANDFNFSTWAEAQATVDADTVTLHTLTAWTPAGVVATPKVEKAVVSFNIVGDSSKVAATIVEEYPTATVEITTSGSATIVKVTVTGATAESTALTLSSDIQSPTSPLSTKLIQNGATPQTSTINVDTNPIVTNPPSGPGSSSSSIGAFTALLAAVLALTVF